MSDFNQGENTMSDIHEFADEILADLVFAAIDTLDHTSITDFFGHLWVDGEIEIQFNTWGIRNAKMMDLCILVNEHATDTDKEKLAWLIAFLKRLDGSRGVKFERIRVAYPREATSE